MLEQPVFLLAAQESSFLIHVLSQTQSVRTLLVPYHPLWSTCVSYRTPYHSNGYQIRSTQVLPRIDQNLPLKKHIFRVAFSKNIFLKFFPHKIHFKNIFSKLFPQKKHLQNCSLKICVFKIAPSKNINLIALIYSSLESLDSSEEEKSLKLSLICPITVFSMYLHSFKNIYW